MDRIFARNVNNSLNRSYNRSLNKTYAIITMLSIFIVLTLIYGYVRYNNFQEFKKVVCEENSKLMNDIEHSNTKIRKINNIKDTQSNNIFNELNSDCVAEWSECGSSNTIQTYSIQMPELGNGVRCEVPDGTKKNCIGVGSDVVSNSGTVSHNSSDAESNSLDDTSGDAVSDIGDGNNNQTSSNLFSLYVLDKLTHGNSENENIFTFSYFIDSIFDLFRTSP